MKPKQFKITRFQWGYLIFMLIVLPILIPIAAFSVVLAALTLSYSAKLIICCVVTILGIYPVFKYVEWIEPAMDALWHHHR